MYLVEVLVEHPVSKLDHTFTYLSEEKIIDKIRVRVPFNNQKLIGYVEKVTYSDLTQDELEKQYGFKMKYVEEVLDEIPLLNDELVEIASYLHKSTLAPKIACLLTMLPKHLKPSSSTKTKKKYTKYIQAIPNVIVSTTKQKQCYEYILKTNQPLLVNDIPFSKGILNKLYEQHAIDIIQVEEYEEYKSVSKTIDFPELNPKQQVALDLLFKARDEHKVALLYGVTGSGKTELYLRLVQDALNKGKSAIMLVPEISLTPMMVKIFKERFGKDVAVLHSKLSEREKYDEYCRIVSNNVKIVVGARSAIFAPLTNIGVIILDEEHDGSYKQDSSCRYHAKDVALVRAKYNHSFVVLGSASPSVESYARATKGIYKLITMTERFNQKPLPTVKIVDMKDEFKKGNYDILSNMMKQKITDTINKNEQVILLMNRRGYANYMLCSNCGHVIKCPHCDVTLTYHASDSSLKCHYCNYSTKVQRICPECKSKNMKFVGEGIQQVEEYLTNRIQGSKVIRYDIDTTSKKDGHEKILKAFENKEYNILLGTQMVAKGLNFPDVTFVGVINADLMLNLPDFRASERTFQLLLQVAGRSGRANKAGEVIIQTYNKEHYAISASSNHNYNEFYDKEIEYRYLGNYPPFCYMVSIILRSKNEKDVEQLANEFANYIKEHATHSMVLGPAKAMVYKIQDKYRYRILVKYTKSNDIYKVLNELNVHLKQSKSTCEMLIDFNPYNQV